ncbi:hypothetical protein Q095_05851 [Pseudomonas aeruginosa PS50]|nr:hypothetical protein Q041_04206 [Pseudomonas aeruginosa BWHPSA028]ETU72458.1 hypothetical protein Q095_05851 [Pseudomonas aeruginosa PS50]ETV60185.1 hypothetical protein Q042_03824 [Pseudomonas aeruginosa BWHPSA037]
MVVLLKLNAAQQGRKVRVEQMNALRAGIHDGFDDRVDPL